MFAKHRPDYLILLCLAFLVVFGLVMLASSSSNLGQEKFGDSFYYLKHQLLYGLGLGFLGFFLGYKIYYRRYEKIAMILLLINIGFLILVFTPLGVKAGGAERWLILGPVTFQPSELLKLTFVVYLAAWLSKHLDRQKKFWKGFVPFLAIAGIISGLLLKQPATTMVAILMGTGLIVYFVSGAKLSYIFGTALLSVAAFAAVVYLTPYRWERIINFIKPSANPLSGGYHINQALIAIGSGKLTGVGFGQSTTKINYLPEPIGDSIFAIIAEELGFIGSAALIMVFAALVLKILLISQRTKDRFGRLMLIGFGSIIGLQTFINIAAISGLIPLTGVPLPFISYGGTALAVFMTMGGIIANISRHA